MSEETAVTEHNDGGETHAHEHPNYLAILILLAIITALEISLPLLDLLAGISLTREVEVGLLLTMMVSKAALVIMFYMHLVTEKMVYTLIFALPVLFAVGFTIFLML